jgi:bacillithiol system protein YtxJ
MKAWLPLCAEIRRDVATITLGDASFRHRGLRLNAHTWGQSCCDCYTELLMHPDLTPLHHVDDLHQLLAESASRPVLLFKHSYTCGVSMEALDELVAHLNDRAARTFLPHYAMVTVQTHRAVSNAIAQKLGVRHETPQALLVRNGRVVWSASHFRVTAAAVDDAIRTQS